MYIIDEIWLNIKEYLFHNIKIQGKHLKNEKNIILFNNVLRQIPRYMSWDIGNGPYILYSPYRSKNKCVRFIYKLKYKKFNYKITTYMIFPSDYICSSFHYLGGWMDDIIENEYYENFR